MNDQQKNRSFLFLLLFCFNQSHFRQQLSRPVDLTTYRSIYRLLLFFGAQTVSVEFFLKQLIIQSFFLKKKAHTHTHAQICDYLKREKKMALLQRFDSIQCVAFLFFSKGLGHIVHRIVLNCS